MTNIISLKTCLLRKLHIHSHQCLPGTDTSLKHVQHWTYLFLVFSRFVIHLPSSPSQKPVILDSFLSSFQTHSVSKWKNEAFQKRTDIFLQFYFLSLFVLTIQLRDAVSHCVSFFKLFTGWQCLPFSLLLPKATYALRFNKVLTSRSLPELPKCWLSGYLFLSLKRFTYLSFLTDCKWLKQFQGIINAVSPASSRADKQ